MNQTLYLNNDGSRWIFTDPNAMKFNLVTPEGVTKVIKARCFESFGNFAVVVFRYKGKQYKAFPESDGKVNSMPVVRLNKPPRYMY